MNCEKTIDALIVGAGPVALTSALALSGLGLATAVIETAPNATVAASSARSAALFDQTIGFLKTLGVWQACADKAAPLRALQFIDDTGRLLRAPDCAFSAQEIGLEAFGYNILNQDLAQILHQEVMRRGVAVYQSGPLTALHKGSERARLSFSDGSSFQARLVIAADGRASATRTAAGLKVMTWAYDQTALAVSFAHEKPHHNRCIEIHRPSGPFTMVPLPDRRTSLVWGTRGEEAQRLLQLDEAGFSRAIEETSHHVLGKVTEVGDRAVFPLSSLMAREFGKDRIVLAGEAAHAAPPIGAQGLNLGFRDVDALRDIIMEAQKQGRDIGGDAVMAAYSTARRGDVMSRTFGVDMLNKSLLSDFAPYHLARCAGLYALGSLPPLRRLFMRRGIAPAH